MTTPSSATSPVPRPRRLGDVPVENVDAALRFRAARPPTRRRPPTPAPGTRPPAPSPLPEAMIERVPLNTSASFASTLDEWKALRSEGWSVSCLIAPDQRSVVWLACRERKA
jgi:hypothetical protein